MNRFDRITAILLILQTKRLTTAQEISERFSVSLRTVYRDIRTLENAGLPIISEAGLGYFLEKGFQLPPVMFSKEEALALFVAEKFIQQSSDMVTKTAYQNALHKIKSVLNQDKKDHLESLEKRIEVQHTQDHRTDNDPWLTEVQQGIAQSHILKIDYFTPSRQQNTERNVEPIGLYFYSRHWHLIAWCREREDFRDFRLDRILSLSDTFEWFDQRLRGDLSSYLERSKDNIELHKVEVSFGQNTAQYTHEQRAWYGFMSEQSLPDQRVMMTFLTPSLDYFARWLLGYTNAVSVISPPSLRQQMRKLLSELQQVI